MTGFWEILLIAGVIASIVVPYMNKKKQARQIAQAKQKKKYQAPKAREVDYEEEA